MECDNSPQSSPPMLALYLDSPDPTDELNPTFGLGYLEF